MIINGKPMKYPTESMEDFLIILSEFIYDLNCRMYKIENKLGIKSELHELPDNVKEIVEKNSKLFKEYCKKKEEEKRKSNQ